MLVKSFKNKVKGFIGGLIPSRTPGYWDRGEIFFVLGCARSGTTSLCRIVDQAENAVCLLEPNPNLNEESRHHLDRQLENPDSVLEEILSPRIKEHLGRHQIYGEKNVTLTAFIKELYDLYGCKFIFATRDGRETVASMHNWHNELFGNFYRECKEPGNLSETARDQLAQLPVDADTSNYSRPRPGPGDPYYEKWPEMSRHEMLCWYWAFINNYAMDRLELISRDRWLRVNYSAPDIAEEMAKVVDFLGLRGIFRETIEEMLNRRINSIADRTEITKRLPMWQDWSDRKITQFWDICEDTMARLGYFHPRGAEEMRYVPDYGKWWKGQEVGLDFFQHIYEDRLPQHHAFMAWVKERKAEGKIRSVCEVGCGRGIGYAEFFADCHYTGVDISEKEIALCREHYKNLDHCWLCLDFIREAPDETFDLVFCQGSIENVYDMDVLIRNMANCTERFLYVTAFKGFFPDLEEHEYNWNQVYQCYDNKLSLKRTRALLEKIGFSKIDIFPQKTKKDDIPYETVVIAYR